MTMMPSRVQRIAYRKSQVIFIKFDKRRLQMDPISQLIRKLISLELEQPTQHIHQITHRCIENLEEELKHNNQSKKNRSVLIGVQSSAGKSKSLENCSVSVKEGKQTEDDKEVALGNQNVFDYMVQLPVTQLVSQYGFDFKVVTSFFLLGGGGRCGGGGFLLKKQMKTQNIIRKKKPYKTK